MSRLSYLKVKNSTDTSADIYFYGDIVGDEWEKWCDTDTCPKDIIDALSEAQGKDLNIYINSGGGSVFAGLAIYNMLVRAKGKKVCCIDSLAGSIASVIAMAADELIMPSNSYLMIHKPSNMVWGNATEMRKMADDLDIIQLGIEDVYKNKLKDGVDIETIRTMMEDETWLTASEAEKYFNVKVVEGNKAVAKLDLNNLKNYKNIPKEFKDKIQKGGRDEHLQLDNELKNKLQIELELLNM
ncbi:ATP-dependent Clp endopeptidase proteolytic subunit ClpP [Clostridium beijerinckii]|uniref:head maturation protease, ClpP-related n=1 Tax=Clostridium beijerinckii TaxID=1520 RepID=UPI001A9A8487|nr:ATP-dependent Clp endopeptidase proteolytic subunit ClpP [Clostridium beijerinckii]NRT48140.1 ATP-dependent Clp endopeptidase proteolytic subunit ClpP [Clostridium beijerinckii]NRZ23563.1 ATP-dependent Clp endopeptidase proteolytic subunit ClpP [Clostridium beijerinckii]